MSEFLPMKFILNPEIMQEMKKINHESPWHTLEHRGSLLSVGKGPSQSLGPPSTPPVATDTLLPLSSVFHLAQSPRSCRARQDTSASSGRAPSHRGEAGTGTFTCCRLLRCGQHVARMSSCQRWAAVPEGH